MLEVVQLQRPEAVGVELNLYTGTDYFKKLADDIALTNPGDRVAVTTMDFDTRDPLVADVFQELYEAAERRVDVVLGVDAFAHLDPRRTIGPIVLPFALNEAAKEARVAPLERLGRLATARCGVTNKPKKPVWNYFAGRSHIKLAVVNNKVYLGGPSLQGSDRLDMVVGFENGPTADALYDIATSIVESEDTGLVLGTRDKGWAVDQDTRILIDAGQPRQSHILEEALRIIDEAEERVTISSPFLLTGAISERLVQAHTQRDVDTYIAYNHVSKHEQMQLVHRAILLMQRLRNPREFFANQVPRDLPALHAKILSNEREAMVTSHNFVETGVKFGTPEIALVRRSSRFAQAVRDLLLSQVVPLSDLVAADL